MSELVENNNNNTALTSSKDGGPIPAQDPGTFATSIDDSIQSKVLNTPKTTGRNQNRAPLSSSSHAGKLRALRKSVEQRNMPSDIVLY